MSKSEDTRVRSLLASAVLVSLLVSACSKSSPALAPVVRDWSAFPAIIEIDTEADIFAIGDVHGDYDSAVALLVAASLVKEIPDVPEHAAWSGGNAVLVSTGDLIDKWTQNLAVLALFQSLTVSAAASGGRVVVLSGNHEAEFLADPAPDNSKAADFVAELEAAGISVADVGSGKVPIGQTMRALSFGARVRDWFFCHAGNTGGKTLAALAMDLQSGVSTQGFGAPILAADDSILEARLSGGTTPWWEIPGTDPATNLANDAAALNAKHIVMGHQPGAFSFSDGTARQADSLSTRFGTLFFIDIGLSRGVDATGGPMLRIKTVNGITTADAIDAKGGAMNVWSTP